MKNLKDKTTGQKGILRLIRHAERPPIPENSFGNELSITPNGETNSRSYGKNPDLKIYAIHSSPIKRCMETASCILKGKGQTLPIIPDTRLGDPGAFVSNDLLAGENWQRYGHEGVCRRLFFNDDPMRGFHPPKQAVATILKYSISNLPPEGFTTICVSHDIIISALAVRLLKLKQEDLLWPDFLEGIEFSLYNKTLLVKYQEHERLITVAKKL